jgi:hypothetical protein
MIEFSKEYLPNGRLVSRTAGTGALDFDRARRWFNETYGWSQEADLQNTIDIISQFFSHPTESNPHWAYHAEYKNWRIYTNEPEAAWFQLKFTNES